VGREGAVPVHNPEFDFNEEVLLLGMETHCQVGLELLKHG
jgi:metal-dependent amidase/aminoacylase/carboxypeptidase family protein